MSTFIQVFAQTSDAGEDPVKIWTFKTGRAAVSIDCAVSELVDFLDIEPGSLNINGRLVYGTQAPYDEEAMRA